MDGLVASWPRCPSREPVWERSAGKLHALRGRQLFRPSREEAHPGVLQGDQGICIVWVGLEGEPLRHLGGRFSCAGCACFFFFFSSTKWTHRRETDQLDRTLQGVGFALVGGICVRVNGSKPWWSCGRLSCHIFHGTSVPNRGNTERRLLEPVVLGGRASTTYDRTRRVSHKHGNPLACSSVEERGLYWRCCCSTGCLPA